MENTENKHDTRSDLPLKQDDPLPFQSAESKEGTKAAPMPNLNTSETEHSESKGGKDKDAIITADGEHQGPQHDDEKEPPKVKQDGPPVPPGTVKPDTIDQTDEVPQQNMPTNGTSQTSQGSSGHTDHGLSDRSAPSGSVSEQGIPTNGASQTSQRSSGFSGCGLFYGSGPSCSAPRQGMPHNRAADMEMLQQLMRHLGSGQLDGLLNNQQPSSHSTSHRNGDAPTTDSQSMQIKSYDKGGYSVVITNGTLCHSSEERGVVEMKSGTQFEIAVGNNNDFAAEVDITFGGIFLGVWLLEAKQTLIVEGSSWAKGRLKFFSTSDKRRPAFNEEFGQREDINGKIEFEFKPEASTLKLVVKHLWKKEEKEICMAEFKTATVKDLKREIDKKFKGGVACLIVGGKILDEDKTMSSYALENEGEVIAVLYKEEELLIKSSGNDSVTMMVDPLKVSVQDVKDFIKQKFNIGVNEQRLRISGQNVHEIDPLSKIFLTAKEKPVVRVDKDEAVNNGSKRGTTTDSGSETTRGGGDGEFDYTGGSGFRGDPSASSTSPTRDPGDAQFDGPGSLGKEGIAMLCGDQENVFKKFQVDDKQEKKFSKKRAVTMIIQLIEKSDEATVSPPPSEPPKEPIDEATASPTPSQPPKEPIDETTASPPPSEPSKEPIDEATVSPPPSEPPKEPIDEATTSPPPSEPPKEPIDEATASPPPSEPPKEPIVKATASPPPSQPPKEPIVKATASPPPSQPPKEPIDEATASPPPSQPPKEPIDEATASPTPSEPPKEPIDEATVSPPPSEPPKEPIVEATASPPPSEPPKEPIDEATASPPPSEPPKEPIDEATAPPPPSEPPKEPMPTANPPPEPK